MTIIAYKLNSFTFFQAKLDDEDLEAVEGELDMDPSNADKMTPLRKGLLWQQRDKLFSQWKERYFILTTDYLQCFKKGSSRMTEMGEFIFKVSPFLCYKILLCILLRITSQDFTVILSTE